MSEDKAAGSIDRVLGILDLFTLDKSTWSIDEMQRHIGIARATLYRYVRALCQRGLLCSAGGNSYMLGPKVVEYDWIMRRKDPLLQVAPPLLREIRDEAKGILLILSYYGDQVLCVYGDSSDPTSSSLMYDRGRPFPLLQGIASRPILANLSTYQLKNLMLRHPAEIAASGLGDNWQAFSQNMRKIAKDGHCAGAGEIDTQNWGVSAPIFRAPRTVIGSLSVGRDLKRTTPQERERLIPLVMDVAHRISLGVQAREKESSQGARSAERIR